MRAEALGLKCIGTTRSRKAVQKKASRAPSITGM